MNSERDHYDDQEKPSELNPAYPVLVSTAGIICFGIGLSICTAGTGTSLAMAIDKGLDYAYLGLAVVCLLFGAWFSFYGWQLLQGKARDPFWVAVLSALLGFGGTMSSLPMLLGLVEQHIKKNRPIFEEFIIMIGCFCGSIILMLSGVFTLEGRAKYREWQKAQYQPIKRNPLELP